jgi:putative nucleotidyltransferase with HDIG domain
MTGVALDANESRPTLDQAVRRMNEISTLPHVALRVMQVASDPKSGARDLKEVMEGDAALSARVLRSVNSSAYATRTKITNLQQAIAYLGIAQIRNLAMTASVSELFAKNEMIGTYRRSDLWRHMVAVGICARMIAMRAGIRNFEDVFLGGLLHDIGIILEDQNLHDAFTKVAQSLRQGTTLIETEHTQFIFDHTTLAEKVTTKWSFPDLVTATIRHHHNSAAYKGEQIEIIWCVEVANLITSLKGMSSVGINLLEFPRAAIAGLSLKKDDLLVLANDLDNEIARNQSLLQV